MECGHNRSSVVSASAELGASTGSWAQPLLSLASAELSTSTGSWEESLPLRETPGRVQPVRTRGLHDRTAKVYMGPPQDELDDFEEVLVSLRITHETLP